MKKVFDELYKLKFSTEQEVATLEKKDGCPTTDSYEGGKHDGKIEGRIEAKKWVILQLDQIISNLLK